MNIRLQSLLLFYLFALAHLHAQQEEHCKTKIIERTVDENGNIISESTRYEYEEGTLPGFDLPGTFDLDGLGFGDLFQEHDFLKNAEDRPTIGVTLDFQRGVGKVSDVTRGSGADESDIRVGDEIISIENIAVASIQDIQEILGDKEVGDRIRVVIFRDGEEIVKKVGLKGSSNNPFFFNFSEEGGEIMDLQSELFERFFGDIEGWDQIEKNLDGLNLGDRHPNQNDPLGISERATLGVFIDDIGAGVLVTDVIPQSAAAKAGVRVDDVITKMDGKEVTGYDDIVDRMSDKRTGDPIMLEIERNGRTINLQFDL